MAKNKLVAPFLKWVGGKRQLMPELKSHIPKKVGRYFEPFLGGGALFFEIQPEQGIVNDANPDLINVYQVIKDNVDELIEDLKKHVNEEEYFYQIRGLDRTEGFNKLSPIQKASRIIYLNKTCFNGLYRVNNAGEFNSPFGRYKNPNIVNEVTLKAVNNYLNKTKTVINNADYIEATSDAKRGNFVYLDPPYDPVSDSSNFTGYTQSGFNKDEQIRLKEFCEKMDRKGVKFMLSNSSTQFIKELYSGFKIHTVEATRAINSDPLGRGKVEEVIVKNYE